MSVWSVHWWLDSSTAKKRDTVTMVSIAVLRKWATRVLGASSSALVIERNGDRNRVLLRMTLGDGIREYDVATLQFFQRSNMRSPQLQEALREAGRHEGVA